MLLEEEEIIELSKNVVKSRLHPKRKKTSRRGATSIKKKVAPVKKREKVIEPFMGVEVPRLSDFHRSTSEETVLRIRNDDGKMVFTIEGSVKIIIGEGK